jgi:hypothetical protein
MINSYHCLCTPGADSKVFFESRNEDVRLIMKEKVNKMFLQLKACKITNPEYSREIDQFMDDVENDVKSGRSFSHAISNASFSYEIRYEKKVLPSHSQERNRRYAVHPLLSGSVERYI